jgi:glucokinase
VVIEPEAPGAPDGLLLVGDVGGTKTDLAVVSRHRGPRERLVQRRYPSREYGGLEDMVRVFLADVDLRVDSACFDVAGPVAAGSAQLTNLPWRLGEADLARALGLRHAWLINDLVATAAAVPLLGPDEVDVVQQGEPLAGSAIAVLAPGTGLGEAFLTFAATAPSRPRAATPPSRPPTRWRSTCCATCGRGTST